MSREHDRNLQQDLALFQAKVHPVLMKQCLSRHGSSATKGDLDLSDSELLTKSGALEGGSEESQLALLIRHGGECGKIVPEIFPHLGQHVDKMAFLHSVHTDFEQSLAGAVHE